MINKFDIINDLVIQLHSSINEILSVDYSDGIIKLLLLIF